MSLSREQFLKNKISELPNTIELDSLFATYQLDINKKVKISAWSRFKKTLSLRAYLIDLVDKSIEKAEAIYKLLIQKSSDYTVVYSLLSIQRLTVWSGNVVGQQILDRACIVKAKEIKLKNDFKVEPKSNPVKEFGSSHTPSTQIKNDATSSAVRLFNDIHPSLYRRAIFVSCALENPGKLMGPTDINDDNLPRDLTNTSARDVPKHSIKGKIFEWIPLTTLTRQDIIRKEEIKAAFPFQLGYSNEAKQFYIKPLVLAKDNTYSISYVLHQGEKKEIIYQPEAKLTEQEVHLQATLLSESMEKDLFKQQEATVIPTLLPPTYQR